MATLEICGNSYGLASDAKGDELSMSKSSDYLSFGCINLVWINLHYFESVLFIEAEAQIVCATYDKRIAMSQAIAQHRRSFATFGWTKHFEGASQFRFFDLKLSS